MRERLMTLACALAFSSCIPTLAQQPRTANTKMPEAFGPAVDTQTIGSAQQTWNELFADDKLKALIDTALKNNQELNIVTMEIELAKNEVTTREGEFLPKVNARLGAGLEKVGKYTSQGVSDETHGVAEHLQDYGFGLAASWEIDIWGKLRNATKAANLRYLASAEGRKFTVTVLVGEIAKDYYELLALDAQLDVVQQSLQLQKEALPVVRLQKESARVTDLAVKRFEAEVFKTESRQYEIQQQIIETENHLNFLVGRFPQHVDRSDQRITTMTPAALHTGMPAQLLENRPDVKRAELDLAATELDVQVARASFFPTIEVKASLGYQAFDILRLLSTPASLLYDLGADLMAPLFNRKAIVANYFSANTKQIQAVWNYERAILRGYTEAATQLAVIENLGKRYELRSHEVEKLTESIEISSGLFKSARADYIEVLTTRRDALESQLELIETKKQQLSAVANLYQALGGGWR